MVVAACHRTVRCTWRRTKPRLRSTASSWRRPRTATTRAWDDDATPSRAKNPARSSGTAPTSRRLSRLPGRLGKNPEVIAKARIEIEAMRLMVLRAAKAMDTMGNVEARVWVSAVKAMVPERVCKIIDEAIQIHGATGVSQWTPLARMYANQRTLRLADGPDEVHWHVVGRAELTRYEDDG